MFQLYEGDLLDINWRPPKGYDGTPNESAADVLTRMRQVLSICETQYSGEDIVFIAPDSDTLSVLQVGEHSSESRAATGGHDTAMFRLWNLRLCSGSSERAWWR